MLLQRALRTKRDATTVASEFYFVVNVEMLLQACRLSEPFGAENAHEWLDAVMDLKVDKL